MCRVLLIFFCLLGLIFSQAPEVYAQDTDVRYMNSTDLQRAQQARLSRKARAKKVLAAKRAARLKRQQARKANQSFLQKANRSNRRAASVPVRKKARPVHKKVIDTVEALENSLPTENAEVSKTLDAIGHIRTFYSINKGANISDLQDDERFKEIYESMELESKKSTYLYIKGVYENSVQAINDKQENPNVKSISELKLNRNYMPTKSDIDGFNEKTSIKSKLVRRLNGRYFKPEKPAAEDSGAIE